MILIGFIMSSEDECLRVNDVHLEILCILRIYICAFPLLARRSTAICQYYVCELSSQQKIRA
jgi:hypothetical protein